MNTTAVIGVVAGAAALGGGAWALLRWRKKKKQQQEEVSNGGSKKGTTSSTTSGSTLWNGLTSAQTLQLQTNLNATRQAFLSDEKNNKNGAEGKAFLKLFNADLKLDGKYGPKTLNAVKALQTYLNAKAGANIKTDGYYGEETDNAYDNWAKKSKNYAGSKKILSGL